MDDSEWHLDKKVPITLIGAILLQTFGFGWWASELSTRVSTLEGTSPHIIEEFTKLETAREANDKTVIQLTDKVDSVLEIVRRNDARNTRKDSGLP